MLRAVEVFSILPLVDPEYKKVSLEESNRACFRLATSRNRMPAVYFDSFVWSAISEFRSPAEKSCQQSALLSLPGTM